MKPTRWLPSPATVVAVMTVAVMTVSWLAVGSSWLMLLRDGKPRTHSTS